jgi:hypothetical protein
LRRLLLPVLTILVLAACGGASETDGSDNGSGGGGGAAATAAGGASGSGGEVVDRQPPGTGYASVDGQEYTFTTPGGVACRVSDDEFSFSFIQGDNEVTIGGGGSIQANGWFGSVSMRIVMDDGSTEYSAQINDNPDAVAVDGSSVSYSGPMVKYLPAPPGELPEPIDIGDGVFSATCA